MNLNEELLQTILPGKILAVQVGLSRTAVLAETEDGIRCGLAATVSTPKLDHHRQPAVSKAGHLHEMSSQELAGLIDSPSFTEAAIGYAAVNALLPRDWSQWTELKAEDHLFEHGAGKNVAIVGHFPFVDQLRPLVKNLWVLELEPKDGDLPADAAPEIIPQAEIVAITAMTLINKTFDDLIKLRKPNAEVTLLGPSTPLSPVLYRHGVDVISGTIVTDPQAVITGIGQGISFRQLRQGGFVRLVTMKK